MTDQQSQLTIDPNDFTLGEMEELEDLAGAPVSALFGGGAVPMRAVVALIYIVRRRDDPTITLDQVKATKTSELSELKILNSTPPG